MKVAFITNLRAPYRRLQLNEFTNIQNIKLSAYYTDKPHENRNWKIGNNIKFIEKDLKGYKISQSYGYINIGLIEIVKENDLIILGCYEQPTYILLSILCRIFRKQYILSFDGISTNRLVENENFFKKVLKKIVINNSAYILGNGSVSERYFNEIFNYPKEKIYNQYLTVDGEMINSLYVDRSRYREKYRNILKIDKNEKVIIYSGRIIEVKNIQSVISALSLISKYKITLLILGGGILEDEIKKLGKKLNVKVIITGFISEQEELFKHYYVGDVFILPSIYEPWGLVVNEALYSGLPVLVSKNCGCSLDLVNENRNGYSFNPYDIEEIKSKIMDIFENNLEILGENSRTIANQWNFEKSRLSLEKIIQNISISKES